MRHLSKFLSHRTVPYRTQVPPGVGARGLLLSQEDEWRNEKAAAGARARERVRTQDTRRDTHERRESMIDLYTLVNTDLLLLAVVLGELIAFLLVVTIYLAFRMTRH